MEIQEDSAWFFLKRVDAHSGQFNRFSFVPRSACPLSGHFGLTASAAISFQHPGLCLTPPSWRRTLVKSEFHPDLGVPYKENPSLHLQLFSCFPGLLQTQQCQERADHSLFAFSSPTQLVPELAALYPTSQPLWFISILLSYNIWASPGNPSIQTKPPIATSL